MKNQDFVLFAFLGKNFKMNDSFVINMNMKKILSAFVLSFVMVGCNQSSSSDDSEAKDISQKSETIKIGGIAPLSGDAASYGIMTQNVVNIKTEEINAHGGINGKPLEVIWEDGKCNPGDASKAAQKLIGVDKVLIILGGQCSGETLGAAPITEKKKVILFSSLSSSAEVTNAGDFVFRTAPSDSSQGKILAEYANKHFQKIGIISEQTDYAVGVSDTFEEYFSGEVVRENYLSSESDFKTRITKLKNTDVEALIMIVQSPPKFDIITKQLEEQDWKRPLLINEVAAGSEDIFLKHKEFLLKNNTIASSFTSPDNENFNLFVERYVEKIGRKPEFLNYTGTILDTINVLAKVLKEVKDETNTEAIRDALYATQDYDGVFGKLSFDENGDVNITYSLFEFNGETFVPLQ